jgi:DNA-binding SARP family transcriptional activator
MPTDLQLEQRGTATATETRVRLLGGFHVTSGDEEVDVPACAARLVAFVALHGMDVDRAWAASCLWLDKTEGRAQANLRSCLWRLGQCDVPLIAVQHNRLRLAPGVRVDLDDFSDIAVQLSNPATDLDPTAIDLAIFSAELLPDWYDEFVVMRRERLRQLRLHALEQLAERLRERGASVAALQIALTAVAAEPLRESAHRLVMRIHLDEGNVAEAVRQFRLLRDLLRDQLGISPSDAARAIISSVASIS